jgi:hypothetical protein
MDLVALRRQSEEKKTRRMSKQQDADRHRSETAARLVGQQSKVLGQHREAISLITRQEMELSERQKEVRTRKKEIDEEKARANAEKALKAAEKEAAKRMAAEKLDVSIISPV